MVPILTNGRVPVPVEMVVERAERVVVRDQPELGAGVAAGAVRPDIAQDILVPGIEIRDKLVR